VSAVTWVWHGRGLASATLRLALAPASALFGAIVSVRNRRFDAGHGVLPTALPALSVGNLSVGGTGKTPVAAWCVQRLREAGGHPAVVLRGYGDDEWRVHTLLSPGSPVVTDPDRVRGVATAAVQGADCVVLDDGFQHRRAARTADLVLLSADAWDGRVQLLPAGPWREPLVALRRASVAVITVKTASETQVRAVEAAVLAAAPSVPIAVLDLVPEALHRVPAGDSSDASTRAGAREEADDARLPLDALSGREVLAVSAIGNPAAFEAALTACGARVTARRFRDHHAFTPAEITALASAVPASGVVVCTLKDAVKLGPLWPRVAPALWYVSQTIVVRSGAAALDAVVQRVLAARPASDRITRPTAG
jgi:tetraacyldisaccharide 4'-kinase